MKNTKRTITGLLFTATLALSLIASGGDAYAKGKPGQSRSFSDRGSSNVTNQPNAGAALLRALGITWE